MTNELMTTLITAGLIIIQPTVTMLIKKARTAAASAGVTTHLWKAVASRTVRQGRGTAVKAGTRRVLSAANSRTLQRELITFNTTGHGESRAYSI